MHEQLLAHLPASHFLGYLILFVGMAIEGEFVLFAALYLASIGYFAYDIVGPVVVAGVFTGDFLWYRLGIFLHNHPSFARARAYIERVTALLDEQMVARPIHTLFISKFAYGLNRAAIARAGSLGIDLLKFLEADIMATFVWLCLMGGISFGVSAGLAQAQHYLKYVEVGFLLGIVAYLVFARVITKATYKSVKKGRKN